MVCVGINTPYTTHPYTRARAHKHTQTNAHTHTHTQWSEQKAEEQLQHLLLLSLLRRLLLPFDSGQERVQMWPPKSLPLSLPLPLSLFLGRGLREASLVVVRAGVSVRMASHCLETSVAYMYPSPHMTSDMHVSSSSCGVSVRMANHLLGDQCRVHAILLLRHAKRRIRECHMRRRIYAWHMRIHACHLAPAPYDLGRA
jgi:hypothetical protein